jgi:hypothetical protein
MRSVRYAIETAETGITREIIRIKPLEFQQQQPIRNGLLRLGSCSAAGPKKLRPAAPFCLGFQLPVVPFEQKEPDYLLWGLPPPPLGFC